MKEWQTDFTGNANRVFPRNKETIWYILIMKQKNIIQEARERDPSRDVETNAFRYKKCFWS